MELLLNTESFHFFYHLTFFLLLLLLLLLLLHPRCYFPSESDVLKETRAIGHFDFLSVSSPLIDWTGGGSFRSTFKSTLESQQVANSFPRRFEKIRHIHSVSSGYERQRRRRRRRRRRIPILKEESTAENWNSAPQRRNVTDTAERKPIKKKRNKEHSPSNFNM